MKSIFMSIFKSKKAKPYVELLYWVIVFFVYDFLFSFHKRKVPAIDHSQLPMNERLTYALGVGISIGLFIWIFSGLLRLILKPLFDQQ